MKLNFSVDPIFTPLSPPNANAWFLSPEHAKSLLPSFVFGVVVYIFPSYFSHDDIYTGSIYPQIDSALSALPLPPTLALLVFMDEVVTQEAT